MTDNPGPSAFKQSSVRQHRRDAAWLAVRYVCFGGVAVCGNLLTQALLDWIHPGNWLIVSLVCGTGAGFVIKYLLDKRWIFFDPVEWHPREVRKITVYGLFSILTTLIFWSAETVAWIMWQTMAAKYLGAALGLLLGYAVKFRLDRRYTFSRAA